MSRSISLPTDAALELLLGFALLAGPFALGLEPAGLVAAVSLGVLMVGLALAGPDSLPLSAHQSFDLARVAARRASCSPPTRRPGCSSRWSGDCSSPSSRRRAGGGASASALRRRERAARVHHRGLDALGDALGGEADLLVQERGRAVRDVAVGQSDA